MIVGLRLSRAEMADRGDPGCGTGVTAWAVSASVTDSRICPRSWACSDMKLMMLAPSAWSPAACAACSAATQYRWACGWRPLSMPTSPSGALALRRWHAADVRRYRCSGAGRVAPQRAGDGHGPAATVSRCRPGRPSGATGRRCRQGSQRPPSAAASQRSGRRQPRAARATTRERAR